jgi:DNA-binding MarR family transcriptional regulator
LTYSSQRRAKADHRQRILSIIESKEPMFKDLQKETKLSPPSLAKHLNELVREGLVARESRGPRRVVFILTNRGKSEEQKRKEAIPAALEILKLLVQEPSATKTLSQLSDLAKDNPTLVELFMKEFSQIMTNDQVIEWIAKHPGREGADVVRRELLKRMGKPEQLNGLGDEEKVRATFQLLSEALRGITAPKEARKGQDH